MSRDGHYLLPEHKETPAEERTFSRQVILKGGRTAFRHPENVSLDPDSATARGWVRSSSGTQWYAVQTDLMPAQEATEGGGWSWATCTCPHGSSKGDSRCYHVAAIMLAALEAHRAKHQGRDTEDDDTEDNS